MSCQAAVRHAGNVAIVDLSGSIALGGGAGLVRGTVRDLLGAGHKNILINLAGVNYMDSSGLAEMAGSYITVANVGGCLRLVNASDKVSSLLQVTKLSTILITFADEESALASFR